MRVRFWGVRGSLPTPATGEDVASRLVEALLHLGQNPSALDLRDQAAVSQWVKNLPTNLVALSGGNTPCVEMRTQNGDLFIIDFGSGVRALGNSLMDGPFGRGEGRAHLFLSHFHWDHIQGWPFFRPAYVAGNQFDLYARHENVEHHLKKQQEAPFFPPAAWDEMRADVRYHTLPATPITLCDGAVRVSSIELNHPLDAYAFRFEADGQSFVYASDGAFPAPDSPQAQPFIDFFRDTDLLVFDAQFTLQESLQKPEWGHSSSVTGVELARRAGAKRLALFHHDPNAGESHLTGLLDAAQNHALNSPLPGQTEVLLAREDLEIELGG
ncbi:MAG: MBL fold metallo-hydrolase [Armatimonadetes bacterium]|nr:MBL fold metallo-hydrolase [Armatimonadota bacterium]